LGPPSRRSRPHGHRLLTRGLVRFTQPGRLRAVRTRRSAPSNPVKMRRMTEESPLRIRHDGLRSPRRERKATECGVLTLPLRPHWREGRENSLGRVSSSPWPSRHQLRDSELVEAESVRYRPPLAEVHGRLCRHDGGHRSGVRPSGRDRN